jgi:hypothetical protein
VVPVVLAVVVGALVGGLRRPHGRHLATPIVVLPAVAAVGVGLQLLIGAFDVPASGELFAASLALLTGFVVVNRHIVGMGVLAVGLAANFAAVLVHGGMPVRASALLAADVAQPGELADVDLGAGRRFERTTDLAPALGDIIPVRPLRSVMSFGDLIALAGVGAVAGELTRYARRGQRWSLTGTGASSWADTGPAGGEGDVIDLTGFDRSGVRFPTERVVEVGVDREPVGVGDVAEHVQELHRGRDVVHPEDRVLR